MEDTCNNLKESERGTPQNYLCEIWKSFLGGSFMHLVAVAIRILHGIP